MITPSEKIVEKVVKTKNGYSGRIEYYESGKYLWSKSSEIIRLTKEDAKADAIFLSAWLMR